MTIAIIGCMDRRLNLFFEDAREHVLSSNPGSEVYIIRDAGGGVEAVEKTLFELNVTEIYDYTHTNCGAMGFAMEVSSKISSGAELDEVESSQDVYDANIRPFLGKSYESRLAIERANKEIQDSVLRHLKATHPEFKYRCELIDIDTINMPEDDGGHIVIVGMAYNGRYSDIAKRYNLDLSRLYFVQANHLEEIRPSIKLAVEKLNIHDVMFISNERSEDSTVEEWSNDPSLRKLFEKHLIKAPVKS